MHKEAVSGNLHIIYLFTEEWPSSELHKTVSSKKLRKTEALNRAKSQKIFALFEMHVGWDSRTIRAVGKILLSFPCGLQLHLIQDNLINNIFHRSFPNKRERAERKKKTKDGGKKHSTARSPPLLSNLCHFP